MAQPHDDAPDARQPEAGAPDPRRHQAAPATQPREATHAAQRPEAAPTAQRPGAAPTAQRPEAAPAAQPQDAALAAQRQEADALLTAALADRTRRPEAVRAVTRLIESLVNAGRGDEAAQVAVRAREALGERADRIGHHPRPGRQDHWSW